jgi:predicted CXXCH cytochrome family protein
MKKAIKTVGYSAVLTVLLASLGAAPALAAVAGSAHDLSITGTGVNGFRSTNQTEICIFCHTPHSALKNDNIPLWNKALSTEATYGSYTSPTFQGGANGVTGVTNAATGEGASVSNLCLSCHDGTVAFNSLANPSNARPTSTFLAGKDLMTGTALLGSGATALANDHPVNFSYAASIAGGDTSLTAPVVNTVTRAGYGSVQLYGGMVQCASCHDPHTSADPTNKAFLRVSMDASTLCQVCHTK